MFSLPEKFEEFGEKRREGFLKVKELKESGGNVVGTFCTYTPKEVIYAAQALPISLCSVSEETIPDAEKHLPKNLCPLIKASYGFAITDKCPYMYYSDMVVGETTCDGKKKMYELLGEIKDTHVMQLPQNQQNEKGIELWKEEISLLIKKLEDKFGVTVSDDDLKKAIKSCNEDRNILKKFHELGRIKPSVISGYEIYTVLNGANYTFDRNEMKNNVREMISTFKAKEKAKEYICENKAPRILITGCPIGGVADKVIKSIEESGAVVVAFENCQGYKELHENVDESLAPLDGLAKKYINIPCSVMTPNKGREDLLKKMVDEYQVDGIVDIILQACHTYNIESHTIKKILTKEKEVSYMTLETDYSESDKGQIKTRLEAFIEML